MDKVISKAKVIQRLKLLGLDPKDFDIVAGDQPCSMFGDHHNHGGKIVIQLPMTRESVARFVGVDPDELPRDVAAMAAWAFVHHEVEHCRETLEGLLHPGVDPTVLATGKVKFRSWLRNILRDVAIDAHLTLKRAPIMRRWRAFLNGLFWATWVDYGEAAEANDLTPQQEIKLLVGAFLMTGRMGHFKVHGEPALAWTHPRLQSTWEELFPYVDRVRASSWQECLVLEDEIVAILERHHDEAADADDDEAGDGDSGDAGDGTASDNDRGTSGDSQGDREGDGTSGSASGSDSGDGNLGNTSTSSESGSQNGNGGSQAASGSTAGSPDPQSGGSAGSEPQGGNAGGGEDWDDEFGGDDQGDGDDTGDGADGGDQGDDSDASAGDGDDADGTGADGSGDDHGDDDTSAAPTASGNPGGGIGLGDSDFELAPFEQFDPDYDRDALEQALEALAEEFADDLAQVARELDGLDAEDEAEARRPMGRAEQDYADRSEPREVWLPQQVTASVPPQVIRPASLLRQSLKRVLAIRQTAPTLATDGEDLDFDNPGLLRRAMSGEDDLPIWTTETRYRTANVGLDLVLVLDVSGSMGEVHPGGLSSWQAVESGAMVLIDAVSQLPKVRLGMIAFGDSARPLRHLADCDHGSWGPQAMGELIAARSLMDSRLAYGTEFLPPLRWAVREYARDARPGCTKLMVIMSDGQFFGSDAIDTSVAQLRGLGVATVACALPGADVESLAAIADGVIDLTANPAGLAAYLQRLVRGVFTSGGGRLARL